MSVQHHLKQWIKHIRHHEKQQYLELELRLGIFQHSQFDAGVHDYNTENEEQAQKNVLSFINHIVEQFKTIGKTNKTWSPMIDIVMQRARYQGDVRHTVYKTSENDKITKDYIKKTTKKHIDVKTSRLFDIRASLAMEEPISMDDEKSALVRMIKQNPPLSLHPIKRCSIWELIQCGVNQYVTLRYDISKVAPPSNTKFEVHKVPCSYHVEMELDISPEAYGRFDKTPGFKPLQDPQEEEEENKYLAKMIWERFSTLLGTHMKDNTVLPEQKHVILQIVEF